MEIKVRRKWLTEQSTISELTITRPGLPDVGGMFTLEDKAREVFGRPVAEWKIPGKTAIPAGRYRVVLSMSRRFGKVTPEILGVPGFSGVRMHPGNVAADTEGCVLPGLTRGNDFIGQSVKAYERIYPIISEAIAAGQEVWLDIQ